MDKAILNIISKKCGKSERSVRRGIKDLKLTDKDLSSEDIVNMVIVYLRIDGDDQAELRNSFKSRIGLLTKENVSNTEFTKYLLKQTDQKDKQLKKKEKQISRYSKAIVELSNKMLTLVDDISMLRIQDTGTVKRLYDKNVLADLLTELEPGTNAHTSIELILKKMNEKD